MQEVRNEEESKRREQAAAQQKQGAWLNWEGIVEQKLPLEEIWRKEQHLLKYLLPSVYDQLPTPSNLVTWGMRKGPNLCGQRGTLRHVLNGCPVNLSQGRYPW